MDVWMDYDRGWDRISFPGDAYFMYEPWSTSDQTNSPNRGKYYAQQKKLAQYCAFPWPRRREHATVIVSRLAGPGCLIESK